MLNILGLGRSRHAGAQQEQEPPLIGHETGAPEHLSEDAVISFVEKEYKRCQDERRPFELQWRLNMAFIEGNQYVEISPVAMDLHEIPQAYWYQEREVFNHIAPLLETRIARLSRMRPILKTRPGTNQQEDIHAAKIGSAILRNTYYEQGIQNLMSEAYAWMEGCGSVFFKNIWDPEQGPVLGGDEMAQIMQMMGMEQMREGDLDIILCPAFEIFPDSSYRQNVVNCRRIIHAKAFHVDEIEETWGAKVTPEQANAMKLNILQIGQGGLGYGRGGFHFSSLALKEHAVVKEVWEVPTKKYRTGRLMVVAGGKLLHYDRLPYNVGDDNQPALPFGKVDSIERAGVFWGKTVTERCIPVQRRYNALKNRKAEYLNRAAIGGWFADADSVDLDEFEQDGAAPGSITVVERGARDPRPKQTTQLPADFDKEENALMTEFNIFSGVSDITKQSKAPAGVKSGVALNLALEQDETRLSSTAANIEQFLVENGKQWLRLYRQYASGMRTLRQVGENNIIELVDWTGADIKSDDVIVESMSATMQSPAQRRQMVFDLMGAGLFIDPDTGQINKEMRSKIFEMIEMGNWESADSEHQLHAAKAGRENVVISSGSMAVPVPYDDHILHISMHNKFRLSTDYEQMMQQNPMVEQMFQAHVDVHLLHMMPSPPPLQGGMPAPGQPQSGMQQQALPLPDAEAIPAV